jgi:hypothetical protein
MGTQFRAFLNNGVNVILARHDYNMAVTGISNYRKGSFKGCTEETMTLFFFCFWMRGSFRQTEELLWP